MYFFFVYCATIIRTTHRSGLTLFSSCHLFDLVGSFRSTVAFSCQAHAHTRHMRCIFRIESHPFVFFFLCGLFFRSLFFFWYIHNLGFGVPGRGGRRGYSCRSEVRDLAAARADQVSPRSPSNAHV